MIESAPEYFDLAMLERLLWAAGETLWWQTASKEVQERYNQLFADLDFLKGKGALPQNPSGVLDVGSGSGAGCMALRKIYPKAGIVALDNRETHQPGDPFYHPAYRFRKPPSGVAELCLLSLEEFAHNYQGDKFELIMAARFPMIWEPTPIWRQRCLLAVEKLISLGGLLGEDGVLIFGYNLCEDPLAIRALKENLKLGKLFNFVLTTKAEFDNWLVLKEIDPKILERASKNPEELLSNKGRRQMSPYQAVTILFD